MNKNLKSPSKLTEFAPLSPEDNQPRVGFYFSKFFKFTKDVPKENKVPSSTREAQAPLPSPPVVPEVNTRRTTATTRSEPFRVDIAEGRSLPNVLKRISNLLALRNNGPRELKQYWMPDSVSKECYDCGEKFTTFRRRHHCRVCGQIFCRRCCDQEIPGRYIGCSGDLRVCNYCCKVVVSYLQSADIGAELNADLRALLAGASPSDAMTVEAMAAAAAAARAVSQIPVGSSGLCIDNSSDGYENNSNRRKLSLGYVDNFALERASERCSETASIAAARERTLALQQSASLRTVFEALAESGLLYIHKNRKLRHKINHPLCIIGNELIDWLLATDRIGNREQGIAIGQAFVEAAYLEVLDNRPLTFMDDDSVYRLVSTNRRTSQSLPGHESHDEPLWVKQIPHQPSSTTDSETDWSGTGEIDENVGGPEANANSIITTPFGSTTGGTKLLPSSGSAFQLDMDFTTNTVQMSRTSPPPHSPQPENSIPNSSFSSGGKCGSESPLDNKDIEEPLSTEFLSGTLRRPRRQHEPRGGWYRAKPAHLSPEHGELDAFTNLFEAYKNHELALCQQLLDQEGLQRVWSEILLSLAHLSVETVRPDMDRDDSMDIRQYVKIKKVSGGERSESQLVAGIVCTKNVTHRGMPRRLSQPTLLLLGCSLVYQHRHEGRLSSLEPVIMQESEYLRHAVNRIVALRPSIVLVQHTVSRIAQDMLLTEGIALVLNVKGSLLERISRSTEAEIVRSLDAQHVVATPKLGRCEAIYVRTFPPSDTGARKGKTLLFLEGCARPELGCTLLLRGGSENELKRAKRVVKWLMFSTHAWRSELAFLMDIHAWPPPPTGEEDTLFPESDKSNEENETQTIPTIRATCPSRSQSESVSDHSDPLRAAADAEDQGVALPPPTPTSITETCQDRHRFRQALEGAILSTSPYIRFQVPLLETDIGRRSPLRSYFPENLYWSRQWISPSPQINNACSDPDPMPITPPHIKMLPSHPFVHTPIRDSIDNKKVQNLLAHFRACGGRIPLTPRTIKPATNLSTQSAKKPEYHDILSVGTHQRLAVLFCCFSTESINAPSYCVSPWVVTMDIYGRNDIPLAAFLDRYCFRAEYACPSPSCTTPMYVHTRRFIHDKGCVLVTLRQLEPPPPPSNSNSESSNSSSSILVWTWCVKCNQVSAVVPLSEDARRLSLAKYLELRFHAGNYYTRRGSSPCKHSLFYDHHHFFARGDTVACFKYLGISSWEVSLPPPSLPPPTTGHLTRPLVIDETRRLALQAHDLYSAVADRLGELALQALPENGIESLRNQLSKERAHFKSNIEDIQLKLTSPTLEAAVSISNNDITLDRESMWRVNDALVKAKRQLGEAAITWNQRLRQIRPPSGPPKNSASSSIVASSSDHEDMPPEPCPFNNLVEHTGVEDSSASPPLPTQSPQVPNELHLFDSVGSGVDTHPSPVDNEVFRQSEVNPPISEVEHQRGSNKGVKAILSQLLPAAPSNSSSSTSLNLLQSYAPLEHHLPVTAAGGSCVPLIIYESEPSSVIAYALASSEYRTAVSGNVPNIEISTSSATPSPSHKRKIASNSTSIDNLESSPLQGTTTNPSTKSSVLSFLKNNNLTNGSTNNQTTSPNPDTMGPITTGDINNPEAIDSEAKSNKLASSSNSSGPSRPFASLHVEVQFSDSSCNFFCRVYFAEQFAQLRASVLPSGAGGLSDEAFIRSLSRCVQWAARGGKSGSTFCKTRDDRFILKAITSKMELVPFLELAPHYFQYVAKCRAVGAPSLLGKMLGVFRVVYRNTNTNAALKVNLLVMENLFYDREVSHKFDLKGSIRNRLVNPDADIDGELVLLDENLLKMCCETPLYVSSQGKAVLTAAINADTQFLASQAVMDYSLLVGLDQSRRHLVVGIIDYIRTFTWDKRLETMVKSTGILGGQGKLPTVVDPELYRQRFVEAMHRYFLSVPDRWSGLSRPLETSVVIGNESY